MNDYNLVEKGKEFIDNIAKKGFIIDIDDAAALPTKDGFIPPSAEVMQAAIEKYCVENHHELKYIHLSDPIIFMLDGNETYEAKPELMSRGRFMREYAIHCVEFK